MMTDPQSIRTIRAQSDSGIVHFIEVETSPDGDELFSLRDGSPVIRLDDGLFSIVASGELLTPQD